VKLRRHLAQQTINTKPYHSNVYTVPPKRPHFKFLNLTEIDSPF